MSMMVNPFVFGGGGGGGGDTARYWRVRFYSNQSGRPTPAVSVTALEFRGTPGGSNLASGGTPYASTIFSSSYPASDAFDGNSSTFWVSSNGSTAYGTEWLAYDFGSDVTIEEIAITKRSDGFGIPEAVTFGAVQYSLDNSTWTTSWEFTSPADWGAGAVTRVFTRADLADTYLRNSGYQRSATTSYPRVIFGDPRADRWVVVGVATNFNTGRSLSAVTIGGVSATLLYRSEVLTAQGANIEFWKANVPTGEQGTVEVTVASGGSIYDGVCGSWICYQEPFFFDGQMDNTVSSLSFSVSIDVDTDGSLIAMSNNNAGGTTVSPLSGVDRWFVDPTYRIFGGSQTEMAAETGRTVSVTWNSGGGPAAFDGLAAVSLTF